MKILSKKYHDDILKKILIHVIINLGSTRTLEKMIREKYCSNVKSAYYTYSFSKNIYSLFCVIRINDKYILKQINVKKNEINFSKKWIYQII